MGFHGERFEIKSENTYRWIKKKQYLDKIELSYYGIRIYIFLFFQFLN